MDGLDAALERARQAYRCEEDLARAEVARDRNRLRKVSPKSLIRERTVMAAEAAAEQARIETGYVGSMIAEPRLKGAVEMLALLDWHGIRRPRDIAGAEHAKRQLLARLEQEPGQARPATQHCARRGSCC